MVVPWIGFKARQGVERKVPRLVAAAYRSETRMLGRRWTGVPYEIYGPPAVLDFFSLLPDIILHSSASLPYEVSKVALA